jgi:hypothetical protein
MDMKHYKYGFTKEQWTAAKEEMRQILIERAKLRGMMPYSELVQKLESIQLEANSYALFAMLGELSTEEDRAGRGMLSVIVVHKVGDMQPGDGFFELAESLGRDTSDILACWVAELKKVYAYWSGAHH